MELERCSFAWKSNIEAGLKIADLTLAFEGVGALEAAWTAVVLADIDCCVDAFGCLTAEI